MDYQILLQTLGLNLANLIVEITKRPAKHLDDDFKGINTFKIPIGQVEDFYEIIVLIGETQADKRKLGDDLFFLVINGEDYPAYPLSTTDINTIKDLGQRLDWEHYLYSLEQIRSTY